MKNRVSMNCKMFTDNLDKYMSNDICDELKFEMKKHMEKCINCKEIYNEEKLFQEALKDSLNLEDVHFKSQKDIIMQKIDKNKYKKNHFKKYIKVAIPVAAAAVCIISINPFEKFKLNNNIQDNIATIIKNIPNDKIESKQNENMISKDKGNVSENEIKTSEENNTKKNLGQDKIVSIIKNNSEKIIEDKEDKKEDAKKENNKDINNVSKEVTKVQKEKEEKITEEKADEVPLEFDEKIGLRSFALSETVGRVESLNMKTNFCKKFYETSNTNVNKWFNSPGKKFSYSVAKEEISDDASSKKIYIKDLDSKKIWALEKKSKDNFNTPSIKKVKWNGDNSLVVLTNNSNTTKEELYIINAYTGDGLKLYEVENEMSSIEDITIKNEKNIQIKIRVENKESINKYNYKNYTIYNIQNDIINNKNSMNLK